MVFGLAFFHVLYLLVNYGTNRTWTSNLRLFFLITRPRLRDASNALSQCLPLPLQSSQYVQCVAGCLQLMLRLNEYRFAWVEADGVNWWVKGFFFFVQTVERWQWGGDFANRQFSNEVQQRKRNSTQVGTAFVIINKPISQDGNKEKTESRASPSTVHSGWRDHIFF